MIPYGDTDDSVRTIPWVTYGLIALNVIFFLVELGQANDVALETFFQRWSVIPIEFRDRVDYLPTIPFPFWFTIFSAMFLHVGLAHIAGNMLYLAVFGDNIEDAIGHLAFLVFYLACGVAAAALYIATNLNSDVPSLGASGAIAGVLGAYLVLYPGNTIRAWFFVFRVRVPAWTVLGGWILLQFTNGLGSIGQTSAESDGVAYAAHIGGFFMGVLLILAFKLTDSLRSSSGGVPKLPA